MLSSIVRLMNILYQTEDNTVTINNKENRAKTFIYNSLLLTLGFGRNPVGPCGRGRAD